MTIVTDIYSASARFPESETFGLTSQMRRSAVSVPSNIAEGQGRSSKAELVRYLQISRGSLYELTTQVEIAGSLGYLSPDDTSHLSDSLSEVERMLNKLISVTKKRASSSERLGDQEAR